MDPADMEDVEEVEEEETVEDVNCKGGRYYRNATWCEWQRSEDHLIKSLII